MLTSIDIMKKSTASTGRQLGMQDLLVSIVPEIRDQIIGQLLGSDLLRNAVMNIVAPYIASQLAGVKLQLGEHIAERNEQLECKIKELVKSQQDTRDSIQQDHKSLLKDHTNMEVSVEKASLVETAQKVSCGEHLCLDQQSELKISDGENYTMLDNKKKSLSSTNLVIKYICDANDYATDRVVNAGERPKLNLNPEFKSSNAVTKKVADLENINFFSTRGSTKKKQFKPMVSSEKKESNFRSKRNSNAIQSNEKYTKIGTKTCWPQKSIYENQITTKKHQNLKKIQKSLRQMQKLLGSSQKPSTPDPSTVKSAPVNPSLARASSRPATRTQSFSEQLSRAYTRRPPTTPANIYARNKDPESLSLNDSIQVQ
jgi:hypothetical protein